MRAALGQPGLRLIDSSFDLADADAGARAYAGSHLPGALYAHLERDLSAPGRTAAAAGAAFAGRHPLPTRAAFAATLGRWGITPSTCVVAMDRQGGPYAARLWWMLRWLGHARAWVL
ncbi:MAG TPA: rhodanese-like domain-containing protein, partial [Burkholderiaceae bacterium]|nr:rhodanese-like domain-containing protein [Burkholderiaceae bacterium]